MSLPEPVRPDVVGAERVAIMAERLIPLIEAMEKELGKERAHQLVAESVRESTQAAVHLQIKNSPRSKHVLRAMAEPHAAACEAEYLQTDSSRFDFDVTSCQYAELFHQMGRPDLGRLLMCDEDKWAADVLDDVTFERSSTLMEGGDRCRFRYGFS